MNLSNYAVVYKVKRGRGRPKLTWDESVKRELKDWDISEKIALDSVGKV